MSGFWTPRTFLGGGMTAPFSPKVLPGLKLWYDAQDNSTLALSGSALTQWKDKSGNGLHSTDDSLRRPTLTASAINGKQGLTFSSSRVAISGLSNSASNYTTFVVHKPSSISGTLLYFLDIQTGRLVFTHIGNTSSKTGYYDGAFKDVGNVLSGPQVLTWKLDSSGAEMLRNGRTIATGTYSQVALGGNASLGSQHGGSSNYYPGVIGEVLLYTRSLSAAEVERVEAYLSNKWLLPHPATASTYTVCDGDSLTLGSQVDPGTQSYPVQLQTLLSNYRNIVINDGVSGDQLTTMDTGAAGTGGIDSLAYKTGAQVSLVVWGGTNDLVAGAQTAAQTYSRLRTYLQNRRDAAKYTNIVVVTAIPRADTATTTKMFDYNTLIRGNWATLQSDGATSLVDLSELSQFNADGDYNDTTYYATDKIHLTATGYGLVASAVKTALDAL